uniref:Uncharacterized protein n=1 Tax=Zea mays TaxID=4577 RepID=B4FHT3_MAIZE|nr:unknown [Zea mays]
MTLVQDDGRSWNAQPAALLALLQQTIQRQQQQHFLTCAVMLCAPCFSKS